jgi:hypothetical protein
LNTNDKDRIKSQKIFLNNKEMEMIDIKNYVEKYLERIFVEPVKIDIQDNKYILNGKLNFESYSFWNKTDEELFNDFQDFSFKKDYIGTIFFFLSGYWEYIHNHIKDNYGRFPAAESFSYKKAVLEEPVVEILIERIKNELNLSYRDILPKAFITHDIDFPSLSGGDLINRKESRIFFDRIMGKTNRNDPWSVYNLIEIHKKYQTKGTFFFMPDIQPNETPGGYEPAKHKKYLQELEIAIKSINGNIGIHYDVRHLIENRMKKDLNRLTEVFQTKIEMGRAHFLLFDITKSFEIYESSGLKLDTTCSFADRIGFRFGTSKPFNPYNFKEKREYELVEVPLIVMDGTLRSPGYMNLSSKEGFEKIKELIDKIKKYNGTFTFLWHNSSFYTTQWREWEWVYEETLKYLKENNFEFV